MPVIGSLPTEGASAQLAYCQTEHREGGGGEFACKGRHGEIRRRGRQDKDPSPGAESRVGMAESRGGGISRLP